MKNNANQDLELHLLQEKKRPPDQKPQKEFRLHPDQKHLQNKLPHQKKSQL